jgi:hypothetical protein
LLHIGKKVPLRNAQGIEAEILFCRAAVKKIGAESPVSGRRAAGNAPKTKGSKSLNVYPVPGRNRIDKKEIWSNNRRKQAENFRISVLLVYEILLIKNKIRVI